MGEKSHQGILVILSMGLGDLLFAIPTLKAIKQAYPDEELTLVTSQQHHAMISLISEVDQVLTYQKKDILSLLSFGISVRQKKFRKAIVLNPVFRGSILAWLSGASERIGYIRDYERQQSLYGLQNVLLTHYYQPLDKKMHEVDRYLDLLKMNGVCSEDYQVDSKIIVSDEVMNEAKKRVDQQNFSRKGPLVIINIGAAWENRRWVPEKFAKLNQWLCQNIEARVLFVGGKSEARFLNKISNHLQSPLHSLVGETNLMELTGLLSIADLVITHDTGPMHIAAATGRPVVALFGPGDLVKVKPRYTTGEIIHHEMPCSPCQFQYTSRCQNNLCMQEIRLAEVQSAVLRTLNLKPREGHSESEQVEVQKAMPGPKKKVLYLQSTSEVSGTDITLLRTLEELNQELFEPHVVLHKEGPFHESYKKIGCQVHILPSMRKLTSRKGIFYLAMFVLGYLPAVFKLVALIKKQRIDIVHTNTIHNLYGFLAAKIAGVPHIWHIREIVVQSKILKEIEVRLVEWFSSKFLVMDNAIAEAFLRSGRGFPKNIEKVYDGVSLQKFDPKISGERVRSSLGVNKDEPVVGIVCRLDPWKGLDTFVEVAKRVHEQAPHAKFWICGGEIEGHEGYEDRLKEKANDYGLNGNMIFSGWKFKGEDIPEVYRALDISVQCPTHPEPYGLVNIEAMASGTPIVTYDRGGPAELCVHDKTALLVKAGDTTAMADAIVSLLKDKNRAEQMAKEGRERAKALFNHAKCVKKIENIYFEVLRKGQKESKS